MAVKKRRIKRGSTEKMRTGAQVIELKVLELKPRRESSLISIKINQEVIIFFKNAFLIRFCYRVFHIRKGCDLDSP